MMERCKMMVPSTQATGDLRRQSAYQQRRASKVEGGKAATVRG